MSRIYSVDLEGNITEIAGTGGVGDNDGTADVATFSQPNGIAVSNDGNYLYVSGTVFATVSGGGSDNAIRIIDLGLSGSSEASDTATLTGTSLHIPALVVGEQYYSVTLTLDTAAATPTLLVAGFEELTTIDSNAPSTFMDNILTIPSVMVDGVDYWARFQLGESDSSRLVLLSADINDSDDDNDGVADTDDNSPYNANAQ